MSEQIMSEQPLKLSMQDIRLIASTLESQAAAVEQYAAFYGWNDIHDMAEEQKELANQFKTLLDMDAISFVVTPEHDSEIQGEYHYPEQQGNSHLLKEESGEIRGETSPPVRFSGFPFDNPKREG